MQQTNVLLRPKRDNLAPPGSAPAQAGIGHYIQFRIAGIQPLQGLSPLAHNYQGQEIAIQAECHALCIYR
jgi:hypothetical protein